MLVSVVMAVYNGARYLRRAVDSVLAQTLTDFEFVIVDDGSTDETARILDGYADARIVRLRNDANIGLTRSLNRCIAAARGEYIARQDADDASLPARLETQTDFLSRRPHIALAGSGAVWVGAADEHIQDWMPQADPDAIQAQLLAAVPFLHGTFMMRRECLAAVGGYDESYRVAQDCDLLLRLSERWDVANVPQLLYVHRRHADTVTARQGAEQTASFGRAQRGAIARRRQYGRARLRLGAAPEWVRAADRRWLSARFVRWSMAARQIDRRVALEFMLYALWLDPPSRLAWRYAGGVVARKSGAGQRMRAAG